MRFVDVIEKKANGEELTAGEISEMIKGYVNDTIPDYQMSAMTMAILQRGMNSRETADLTTAMMYSGDVIDLSDLPGIKLDKHSTGGVGDTTSIVVAPLVAACGGTVGKMSGRGLGHTGGTLDKLESIPGCQIELPIERFKQIVKENGLSIIGQSGNLVPADKKLYALRDVTATVRSIPLIASSIMSKKLAAGTDAIVLDVKTGSGAFMEDKKSAFELAELMVRIGTHVGREVRALVTDMNQPLGMAVGNALEVQEAVEFLSGNIPEGDPLYEVCMLLGVHMMMLGKLASDEAEARKKLQEAVRNGEGLRRLQRMVAMQGGDSSYLTCEKMKELVRTEQLIPVTAEKSGYIVSMNAQQIGTAAQMLGAGRAKKEDSIDPAVGLVMQVRCGDMVKEGDTICILHVNKADAAYEAADLIRKSVVISAEKAEKLPMIYGVVTKDGIRYME